MNQLQFESSPYLKQHIDNPVDWRAWSAGTLEEAKKLNKPILVSIGYSTCHWCHVMAHESFEDPDIAAIMNDYFINIKIDREERPDLDHYFMNAIQAMGISGGWPLHCFLSPDAKPFFGGTYFPPEPKYGRPSWKQILFAIHQAFQNKREDILGQAEQLYQHLMQLNDLGKVKTINSIEINLNELFNRLKTSMDHEKGGFGKYPKFPNTQGIQLLFHLYFLTGNKEAIQHGLFSLRQMCLGGIYDQIDGGFCRYSVDGNWDVPHFEKMLYDHAQLIQTLSIGYQYSKSPLLKRVVIQSLDFFEKQMQDKCGLFYAAMDADSDGHEGTYYVWTIAELKELIGEDYKSFMTLFACNSLDHMYTDSKVLRIKDSLDDDVQIEYLYHSFENTLSNLRNKRNERTQPSIDKKMIVSWNAMMVSAYVSWYKVSLDESFLLKAVKLMNSILNLTSIQDIELSRYYINGKAEGFGFLEDYAYSIKALLDLFIVTQNEEYVSSALKFFECVHEKFKNQDSSIYNVSSSSYTDFDIQQMDWTETTYPNPNAILSWSCKYFYEYTQNKKYSNISESLLKEIQNHAIAHPLAMASWIQQILNAELGYIILKTSHGEQGLHLLKEFYFPGLMRVSNNSNSADLIFCFGGVCHRPVSELEEVVSLFSNYRLQFEKEVS